MAFSPEDPNFARNMRQRGRESIDRQEANKKLQEQKKEERERAAALGATGINAGMLGIAGAAVGGGFWTLGQVLKYSLLGWTLDANGVPRKDAAALKTFEDAYKATKEGSILGGIAKGFGMAA